jgi:pyridoxine 5-phosphate synthase
MSSAASSHTPLPHPRLGVNIDHVATIRNARGGDHPSPLHAALISAQAGADGITAHLREDRRHIRDADITALMQELTVPLNLEMAATQEMLGIALKHKPHAVCLVPEKRQERTTEGGLDCAGQFSHLAPYVAQLRDAGMRVSLFIEPHERQLEAAARLQAPVVEFHTGRYALLEGDAQAQEVQRIAQAATLAQHMGIEPHAGHGLRFSNTAAIAALPEIAELNIGHFLIGEAVFLGLAQAVAQMKALIKAAR